MRSTRLLLISTLIFSAAPVALPQALPNLALVRLNYTVRKRTTNPQGELKAKIDANDAALNEATRLGQMGEVRRLLAKGQTLLAGGEWTPELDFGNSVVLRADHVVVDTSHRYILRIEQIYSPAISLDHALTAKVALRKLPRGGRGGAGAQAAQAPEIVKELGSFQEVSRDLRESPYMMELDLAGVEDGSYQIHVEVQDGSRTLASPNLRIVAVKDVDASLARLESAAKNAPEIIRADALYPIDFLRKVNKGEVDIGTFDASKEIAMAEQVMSDGKSGKDPFAGRTGDFKRHYFLKAANEIMPYRLYIPPSYDGTRAFPMVLALHGLGGTEDSMFGANYRALEEATKRNYILVAPMGYRIDGGYGRVSNPPNHRAELSEEDVMTVLARVRKDYKIDDRRIYLMGHSMGGIGTWTLGAKYPDLWAALAPISGNGNPRTLEKMKSMPEVVVHGDADTTVPVQGSRVMVEEMKRLGIEVKYIEVPGGSHTNVPGPNMAAIFDFFDTHKKAAE